MIYNVTYRDKKIEFKITKLVGHKFSFRERIKMKGIGASKMQIIEASTEINKYLSENLDTSYCTIELRKKGIVVGFNSVMRIYAWCIPYHFLNIYMIGGGLSIFGPKYKIKAIPAFNRKLDKDFVRKMLRMKADVLSFPE